MLIGKTCISGEGAFKENFVVWFHLHGITRHVRNANRWLQNEKILPTVGFEPGISAYEAISSDKKFGQGPSWNRGTVILWLIAHIRAMLLKLSNVAVYGCRETLRHIRLVAFTVIVVLWLYIISLFAISDIGCLTY